MPQIPTSSFKNTREWLAIWEKPSENRKSLKWLARKVRKSPPCPEHKAKTDESKIDQGKIPQLPAIVQNELEAERTPSLSAAVQIPPACQGLAKPAETGKQKAWLKTIWVGKTNKIMSLTSPSSNKFLWLDNHRLEILHLIHCYLLLH